MALWQEFERLPNQITLVRVLFLMPLYYFAFVRNELLFLVFFIIAAATDAVDGFVARKLRDASQFGAKFDSLADFAFFWISIPLWMHMLYPEIIRKNYLLVLALLAFFIITYSFMLIKFKRFHFMHLITSKATVLILSFFTVYTLILGFNQILLYIFCLSWAASLTDILWNCVKAKNKEQLKKSKSIFSLK